ncbi:hypothetical protein IMSAGC016_00991 [Muribaculaceae bacterium]|nr:hypothetical protein IMSAGC016_00991 [Muribaculaceae bacterium]
MISLHSSVKTSVLHLLDNAQIPKKVSQNSPVLELPLKFTLTVRILEKVGLQHLLVPQTEMSPINSLIATTQVLYEALQ